MEAYALNDAPLAPFWRAMGVVCVHKLREEEEGAAGGGVHAHVVGELERKQIAGKSAAQLDELYAQIEAKLAADADLV